MRNRSLVGFGRCRYGRGLSAPNGERAVLVSRCEPRTAGGHRKCERFAGGSGGRGSLGVPDLREVAPSEFRHLADRAGGEPRFVERSDLLGLVSGPPREKRIM